MHTKATLRKKERRRVKIVQKKREEREKSMLQQVKVWRRGRMSVGGVV